MVMVECDCGDMVERRKEMQTPSVLEEGGVTEQSDSLVNVTCAGTTRDGLLRIRLHREAEWSGSWRGEDRIGTDPQTTVGIRKNRSNVRI
jgi:hypothetical protein